MLVFSTRKFKQWCRDHNQTFDGCERWTKQCEGREPIYNPLYKEFEIDGYLISKIWCVNRK